MSGPFNIGDVVVCVDAAPPPDMPPHPNLNVGRMYKVVQVLTIGRASGVNLLGLSPRQAVGFRAERFRHLPKADDQFIQQMRAIKPVREGVSA